MTAVAAFLVALLRALIPVLVEEAKDTAEDGVVDVDLRERLRRRVRDTWLKATGVCVLVFCLFAFPGCSHRTIYVPDGTPVRLRETIPAAKVWVLDESGRPVAGVMDLPAGWYALPDPGPGATAGDSS